MRIEFSIVRLPDKTVSPRTFDSFEVAQEAVDESYAWKADRYRAAEENRDEFDQHDKGEGPFPPTNDAKYVWDKGHFSAPPIKDQDWFVARREVTDWVKVEA